jgi:8-amino-7-oxononanoate synthase
MSKYDFLDNFLESSQEKGRLRSLQEVGSVSASRITIDKKEYINFSSNDYLGLSQNDQLKKVTISALQDSGSGATSSRLVCGNLSLNQQLENKITNWKECEDSLLINSGYQANIGLIPAIADRHTLIFSDKLNHASIIDGIKLSGAKHYRYKHNNTEDLLFLLKKHKASNSRKIIISETLFSMDGDFCQLESLIKLSKEYDTLLYIDDAHGSGISGTKGIGICENHFKQIDIYMGTFGKAHGSFGAYCCCSTQMKKFLINKLRTLIFSTGLPPAILATNKESINLIIAADKKRVKLNENINILRDFLKKNNFKTIASNSPVIPIIIGDEQDTLSLSHYLKDHGIIATAIRPPTVPDNTARIRFTMTSEHSQADINLLTTSLTKWQSQC